MIESDLDQLYGKYTSRMIPIRALIELTTRCNQACRHCARVRTDPELELTTAEVCRVLDELAEWGVLMVSLSGGEPFLRDDFFEILEHADRLGFAMGVLSNGTLIDEHAVRKLSGLKRLFRLSLSIHGVSAPVHEDITVLPGSFQSSAQAVDRLLQAGLRVKIHTVMMKPNAEEIRPLERYCGERGMEFFFDTTVLPKDDFDDSIVGELSLAEEDRERILGQKREEPDYIDPNRVFLCNLEAGTINVTATGDIVPCVALRLPLGNVRDGCIRELWLGSEFLREFAALRQTPFPDCSDCSMVKYCSQCIGQAYLRLSGAGERLRHRCPLVRCLTKGVNMDGHRQEAISAP